MGVGAAHARLLGGLGVVISGVISPLASMESHLITTFVRKSSVTRHLQPQCLFIGGLLEMGIASVLASNSRHRCPVEAYVWVFINSERPPPPPNNSTEPPRRLTAASNPTEAP